MIDKYEQQAQEFLHKTETTFSVKFLEHNKYFQDDNDMRDIYEIILKKNSRCYTFNFGCSLNDSKFRIIDKNGRELHFIPEITERITPKNREVEKSRFTKRDMTPLERFRKACIKEFGSIKGWTLTSPEPPTSYDILSSLTKDDVGTFGNFCSEFGYDNDSIKALKTYEAVTKEYRELKMIYSDKELELMRNIQ